MALLANHVIGGSTITSLHFPSVIILKNELTGIGNFGVNHNDLVATNDNSYPSFCHLLVLSFSITCPELNSRTSVFVEGSIPHTYGLSPQCFTR